ncbi:hypothetical protein [Methanobrevibacter sp.]|uniref:hypothetical protein n=1 Tax=Methanobrevibacter sp. TaxID=66852 RepID=UPI003866DC63
MKKLLLVILIFLIIGAVSAHDDSNATADPLLKDREYTSDINDDDGPLVIEEDDYIPVEVRADEKWSLNVYIDKYNSTSNGEFNNVQYREINIPTSVMVDDNEVNLALGKHNIVYEFKFTNTKSIYRPDAYISDSAVYFDFNLARTVKTPQNLIYRFSSQFNIIPTIEPTSTTFDLEAINITRSDSISFYLRGISYSKVNLYLDGKLFNSFETDDNPYEDEIDTTKLAAGSYNLVCTVETDKVYAEYNVKADTTDSMINVRFTKSKTVYSPKRYSITINTTLNVCEFPELNPIHINAPQIDISYTRSIPVRFVGEGAGDFAVYIDGENVYNNSILLSWENICYIPTKDSNGNYFDEGNHNISFEFVSADKYSRFNPQISWYDNALTFYFLNSQYSGTILNDKYIANTKLKIINENPQVIPIDSKAIVKIVHTNDIDLKIDNLPTYYTLTVFVDDVEIYDSYTNSNEINIKTFFERSSIEETNERDIQTGTHSIRFEFKTLYNYDVDASFRSGTLHFKFNPVDSDINPKGVYYQFNTSLIVTEKKKTVHILNVKNQTYFDFTEFVVKMDLYKPESDDDWDDDDNVENPIGTQDVGIIVSDETGIVRIEDNLMNVYEHQQWNYEFENENLPKAGIYTMKIINLADNTYDTATFEVKKANRIFKKKYSSEDFNVLFTLDFSSCKGDLNVPCHITLNNEEKVINLKNLEKNKKEVLFKDVDPGVYIATFTLKGNEIYNDVTLKSKVIVEKQEPTIKCHQSGENKLDITIDISKSKTDAVLVVSAGGEQKKFTITKNTKHLTVEFDNLNSGSYDVEIDFKGNERYTQKTLSSSIEITSHSKTPVEEPDDNTEQPEKGSGNNTGGNSIGSGDSNATGSGNGTTNGKISLNGKGFNGDFGSQGSGHGDGAKSYEITKNIIKTDNTANTLLIFFIISLILLFLSFIYERREKDEEEY